MRVQVYQRHRGLGREVGIAGATQRYRHGGNQGFPRHAAVDGQVAPQGAAGQRQHDVVELGVVCRGQRLQCIQRQRKAGKGARASDGHVQGCVGSEGQVLTHAVELAGRCPGRGARCTAPVPCLSPQRTPHQAGQGTGHVGQVTHELHDLRRVVLQRRCGQFGHAGVLARFCAALRHRARFGRDVEQGLRQQHAGLAVEHRVVHLDVVPPLAAGQPIDDVQPPQRPLPVEQFAVQACGAVLQLGLAARGRQRAALHVVVDVDRAVVDPGRVGKLQRHRRQLALEDRRQVQPALHQTLDVGVKVATVAGRQIEQMQRRHVHRRLGRFKVQECTIQSTEWLHARVSSSCSRACTARTRGCSRLQQPHGGGCAVP